MATSTLLAIVGVVAILAIAAIVYLGQRSRKRRLAHADEPRSLDAKATAQKVPSAEEKPVPTADELVTAQREAARTEAELARAQRERARLEAQANLASQTGDDEPASIADDNLIPESPTGSAKTESSVPSPPTAEVSDDRVSDPETDETTRVELEAARAAERELEAKLAETKAKAQRLRQALEKTRGGFVGKIGSTFRSRQIDEAALEELEVLLFGADVGVKTTDALLERLRKRIKSSVMSLDDLIEWLREDAREMLKRVPSAPLTIDSHRPHVVMIVGVNGAGKTTTIGKLAHHLTGAGHQVTLGAGDTFRAAAVEQLQVWSERNGCGFVKGKDGADPASVLFDAIRAGEENGSDVILCDTAGRLHTSVNLMEELGKVHRVIGKAKTEAPHDVLLVLDATVGQNAIHQAQKFNEAVPLSGIVLTKLDGTAKGGVILGIANELGVPVRYIGVGEAIDDLRPFDADSFVDALFSASESIAA